MVFRILIVTINSGTWTAVTALIVLILVSDNLSKLEAQPIYFPSLKSFPTHYISVSLSSPCVASISALFWPT